MYPDSRQEKKVNLFYISGYNVYCLSCVIVIIIIIIIILLCSLGVQITKSYAYLIYLPTYTYPIYRCYIPKKKQMCQRVPRSSYHISLCFCYINIKKLLCSKYNFIQDRLSKFCFYLIYDDDIVIAYYCIMLGILI